MDCTGLRDQELYKCKIPEFTMDISASNFSLNTLDNENLAAIGELTNLKFISRELYTENIILLIIIIINFGLYSIKNYKS
jgi:hypothetical protein